MQDCCLEILAKVWIWQSVAVQYVSQVLHNLLKSLMQLVTMLLRRLSD